SLRLERLLDSVTICFRNLLEHLLALVRSGLFEALQHFLLALLPFFGTHLGCAPGTARATRSSRTAWPCLRTWWLPRLRFRRKRLVLGRSASTHRSGTPCGVGTLAARPIVVGHQLLRIEHHLLALLKPFANFHHAIVAQPDHD